jgi:hypothetical protein
MIQEVAERGRLLNMPVLRKVRTPSQKATVGMAAMAITSDNFDPNSVDKRPLAWQAVKLRRVFTKEDIYRRQGQDEASIQAGHQALLAAVFLLIFDNLKSISFLIVKLGRKIDVGRSSATWRSQGFR